MHARPCTCCWALVLVLGPAFQPVAAVQMTARVASQHADVQAQLNRMAAFFSGSSEDVNKNWLRWVQRVSPFRV